jgi:glyoxylase-like metal-dependent hydrolase (beta-lactamase superfamily II)
MVSGVSQLWRHVFGSKDKIFRKDEDMLQTIESLKFLLTLEFDKLFCGHNPKMQQPKTHLQRKINHLENIYDDVKKAEARRVVTGKGHRKAAERQRVVACESNHLRRC